MGGPEGRLQRTVSQPPDLRLQAQQQQAPPGHQSCTGPAARPAQAPQGPTGGQGSAAKGKQSHQSLIPARERQASPLALQKRPDQGDQHRHHRAGRDPATVIGVLHRHGGGQGIDLEPPLPHQNPQPDGGPHHGIHKQDHQGRVEQGQPVEGGHHSPSGEPAVERPFMEAPPPRAAPPASRPRPAAGLRERALNPGGRLAPWGIGAVGWEPAVAGDPWAGAP